MLLYPEKVKANQCVGRSINLSSKPQKKPGNGSFYKEANIQNPSEITISIHLLSGDPIVFTVEATADRQRNAGARIESSMSADYIGVELEGKLVVVPTKNIQKIEISPAPTAIISHVVKGAKLVS